MSCDVDKINHLRKGRKKSWLSSLFSTIFGCTAKRKSLAEKPDTTFTSVAVQCLLLTDLEHIGFQGEPSILVESNTKLDITIVENDISPRTQGFQTSLKKIDKLINALNDIQGLCNKNTLQYALPTDEIKHEEIENKLVLAAGPKVEEIDAARFDEIVKFNINIDDNALIQCHTNRGKHSLKIIQNSGQKNYNPLLLHRCETDHVLTKNQESICKSKLKNRKTSSETSCQELQRTHSHSPEILASSIFNLSLFKSNLVMHLGNIREDVKTLKGILFSIECLVKDNKVMVPFYFDEIKKWFSERDSEIEYSTRDVSASEDVMKLESSRIVEAKTRATNFCKFYTLAKVYKTKSKPKKYTKS